MKLFIYALIGIWLPGIVKTEITCGPPPPIDFATINNEKEEYSVGDSVSYSCQYGYVSEGSTITVRCESLRNEEAEWTQPEIRCIPRSCGDPGTVEHGHRIGFLFTFPNSVTFECDSGYKLRGNAKRFCQTNGYWSGRLPTCRKFFCDPPENPKNGRVSYVSLEYLSELKYECDKGYRLNDAIVVYCAEDGQWSEKDISCEEVTCPFPENPENGFVEVVSSDRVARSGSLAVFSCKDGFFVDGPTTSKCLENGEWTFPASKCLEPCSVPFVKHGKIGHYPPDSSRRTRVFREIPVGSPLENGMKLFLHCNTGFDPLGSSNWQEKVVCTNGKWSVKPECVPASCRLGPPSTENARIRSVNTENGGTVVYSCLEYYRKSATGNVTCDHGVWKGIIPTCKDTRCYTKDIQFTGLEIPKEKFIYMNGDYFEIYCSARYKVTEAWSKRVECEDGQWKAPLPPCVAAGCTNPPPQISNGRIENWSSAHFSTVTYTCNQPYAITAGTPVRCEFGEWKGNPPDCVDSRCNLKDLKRTEGVSMNETPAFTDSGQILDVRCIDGYSLTKNMPSCYNGRWSLNSGSPCKESDCTIRRVANGYLAERKLGPERWSWTSFKFIRAEYYEEVPVNSFVPNRYSDIFLICANGYSVHGSGNSRMMLTCYRGTWSLDPVCLLHGQKYVSTPKPVKVKETLATSSRVSVTTAAFTGSSLSSNEYFPTTTSIIDESGEITHVPSVEDTGDCYCQYNLNDDKILAFVDGDLLSYGSSVMNGRYVKFRCRMIGYHRFFGPHEVQCEDCQWSSTELPSCTDPLKDEAVVFFNESIPISNDGTLHIRKGNSVRINCVSSVVEYPRWNVTDTNRVYTTSANIDTENGVFHTTNLYIKNIRLQDEGYYSCQVRDTSPAIIRIMVEIPDVRCPLFLEEEIFIVAYSKEQRPGSTVTFTCRDEKQKLVGKNSLTCLPNGQWSDTPPVCEDLTCPLLMETDYLLISYTDDQRIGSNALFHCFSPGVIHGNTMSTCLENGQWSDAPATCEAPPCSLESLFGIVPNGIIPSMEEVSNDTIPYGTTLKLVCELGLVLHGNQEAKCIENSQWSTGSMQCLRGCGSIEKMADSKLVIHPLKDKYVFGESVLFSCPSGKRLTSDVQRVMCLNSGWSESTLPDCEEEPEEEEP